MPQREETAPLLRSPEGKGVEARSPEAKAAGAAGSPQEAAKTRRPIVHPPAPPAPPRGMSRPARPVPQA